MKDYTNDQVTLIKEGDIYYLQFNILNKYSDKLKHAITLRHGGVSKYPIDTLNFRTTGNDKIENVLENVNIISNVVGFSKIYKAKQKHTDNILILDNNNKKEYKFENLSSDEYDGYITKEKNIATLITTADCNPIIIYDPKQNIIANVHSGWAGTIKKITIKAIKILNEKFNSKFGDLIVCIGPSIRKCCFSSEDELFKKKFTDIWNFEDEYIYYMEDKKRFHIDLLYVIKKDLIDMGIKKENIADANICTMCNSEDFFSYRTYTKNKFKDYGLMATIVELI